eukprot:6531-Rhodomonas_salina.1
MLELEEECEAMRGAHFRIDESGQCRCKLGFEIDSAGYCSLGVPRLEPTQNDPVVDGTEVEKVKATQDQFCRLKLGVGAKWIRVGAGACGCGAGYREEGGRCVSRDSSAAEGAGDGMEKREKEGVETAEAVAERMKKWDAACKKEHGAKWESDGTSGGCKCIPGV